MPEKRPVYFDLHILPLFRLADREAMMADFDLWDYQRVKRLKDEILRRLDPNHPEHSMMLPAAVSGGPWPAEWLALFRRWIEEGCRNLELALALDLRLECIDPRRYRLRARGTHPDPGYTCWFQRLNQSTNPREYILYREPPLTAAPGNPAMFEVELCFCSGVAVKRVIVMDEKGIRTVPLTAVPPTMAKVD